MLSLSRLFSRLFLWVSEAPQPDCNLTDGSHLLCFSNQNQWFSWVAACALSAVPSISEADEGSLVKLRQSREAWRPALSKKEWCFLPFLPHCELTLSSRQIYCFPSNYTNKQVHSNKEWQPRHWLSAQRILLMTLNSIFKNLLAVSVFACLLFLLLLLLLVYLLPSLSNMPTFKQGM